MRLRQERRLGRDRRGVDEIEEGPMERSRRPFFAPARSSRLRRRPPASDQTRYLPRACTERTKSQRRICGFEKPLLPILREFCNLCAKIKSLSGGVNLSFTRPRIRSCEGASSIHAAPVPTVRAPKAAARPRIARERVTPAPRAFLLPPGKSAGVPEDAGPATASGVG